MTVLRLLVPVIVVMACGAGGYAIGSGTAPTTGEAEEARIEARAEAARTAEKAAFAQNRAKGRASGLLTGRKLGAEDGAANGSSEADEQLAAQEPPLVELPHGELGYALPESERSLSCVGIDADTGRCIGD